MYPQWPSPSLTPPAALSFADRIRETMGACVVETAGLGTSLSALEGPGWALHLCLLLTPSCRASGKGPRLPSLLSLFSCMTLGQPLLRGSSAPSEGKGLCRLDVGEDGPEGMLPSMSELGWGGVRCDAVYAQSQLLSRAEITRRSRSPWQPARELWALGPGGQVWAPLPSEFGI